VQPHARDATSSGAASGPSGLVPLPYSTRFFAGNTIAGTVVPAYTVPATYVAVIRDIEVLNSSGSTDTLFIAAVVPGPLTLTLTKFLSLAAETPAQWKGRAVMNAGDELELFSVAEAWEVIISGYLLGA
jgi:hypothetical protein